MIHAGVHKTGTTTLQHFLATNTTELLSTGVYYPAGYFTQYRRQHSALANALRRGDAAAVRRFFLHCVRHGAAEGAHTSVISGEELSLLNVARLRSLRAQLLHADPSAEILAVLYYRNLYDHAISSMQQAAKSNRRLFESRQGRRTVARMNPTQQLTDFEQVFGEPNVAVGIFDSAVRGDGLERDFLRIAGIPWSGSFVVGDSRNVSMDLISTTFVNMLGFEYDLDSSLWRNYAKVAPQSFMFPRLRNDLIEDLRPRVEAIDISHPKLDAARATLIETTTVPEGRRADPAEFLAAFEALVRQIRIAVEQDPSRAAPALE